MAAEASSFIPEDDDLGRMIHELVPSVDIRTTGVKAFTKLLAKHITVQLQEQFEDQQEQKEDQAAEAPPDITTADLKVKSKFIKAELTKAINDLMGDAEEEEEEEDEEQEVSEEEEKPKRKAAKKKSSGGGGGLSQKKLISSKMAKFLRKSGAIELGTDNMKEVQLARTEIVKGLWDYIKKNDLQDPNDKREILLDDRMQKVFNGTKSFSMFSMNRYISSHIEPFPSIEELETKAAAKKKAEDKDGTGKAKRKRKAGDGAGAAKKRKAGTQPPYRLSEALSELLGKDILPRPQVVSGVWEYIKSNGLQNPDDGREILCDDRLKVIMGNNSKVTMFNMNKFITPHLVEKLDKSAYQHDGDDEDGDE